MSWKYDVFITLLVGDMMLGSEYEIKPVLVTLFVLRLKEFSVVLVCL